MTDYDTSKFSALHAELLETVLEEHPTTAAEIAFASGGTEFGGFIARPALEVGETGEIATDTKLRPGVLIISDWSGLGDHARVRALMLARLGYVGFAGDVYGGGVNLSPDKAGPEAGKYYADPAEWRIRLAANLERLRQEPGVDPDKIAVMGYCFGGSAALEAARAGEKLAAVVSFHGRLSTAMPAEPGSITAPILVLTGAADPVVPDDQVIAFENELRTAGAPDWQVVSYSGAMHAFTMPGTNSPERGAAFDATANARSWVAMRAFFDEVLA